MKCFVADEHSDTLFPPGATLLTMEEKIVLKYYNHGTHILKNKKSILIIQAKGAGVKPSPQSHSETALIKFSL